MFGRRAKKDKKKEEERQKKEEEEEEEEIERQEETEEKAQTSEEIKRRMVYHVSYDSESRMWRIFLEKGPTIEKYATKEEALTRVKELSNHTDRGYVVHLKSGKLQKK